MSTKAETAIEKPKQLGMDGLMQSAESQVAAEAQLFELAQRKAAIYAKSDLVPKIYQNNIGNVLIADNMAKRMGADLLMVMQNLYVVHGNPGWSGQFLIASFNSNGKFTALKYRSKGEEGTDDYGWQAYCTEVATGEEIAGPWITWAMVKGEGWLNKTGSKWKTMPEQMFRYRAATFLIRSTAPEIGMGLLTKEELEDMPTNGNGVEKTPQAGIGGMKERMGIAKDTNGHSDTGADVDAEVIEPEQPASREEFERDRLGQTGDENAAITAGAEEPEAITEEPAEEAKPEIDKQESQSADLKAYARELYADAKKNDRDTMKKMNEFLGQRLVKDLEGDDLTAFCDTFSA
jgi:hypothetical protein